MFPLKVRWQKTQYAPILNISIEHCKSICKTPPIQVQIFHQMLAGKGLRGAAAFKNSFGFKLCCGYFMRFKKRNRQRRDVFERLNSSGICTGQIAPLPVNRVLGILKPESVKALIFKKPIVLCKRENIVNIKRLHGYVL